MSELKRRLSAHGFLLDGQQVVGQVTAQTLLNEPDRHAHAALNGQVIEQGGAIRQSLKTPRSFETPEVTFDHPKLE